MQFRILVFLFTIVFFSCNQKDGEAENSLSVKGQLVTGQKQLIKLEGYNGFNTYLIDSTFTDETGKFELTFSSQDFGAAIISSPNQNSFLVILNEEGLELIGESLVNVESVKITRGKDNLLFQQYALDHPFREQALSAWDYLEKIYQSDSIFINQKSVLQNIQKEKRRIVKEDEIFLSSLPRNSFIAWYLAIRKKVSSVSTVAQYRPDEIPSTISFFRTLDYSNPWLYKSGLLKESLESHFWLLENSGESLEESFLEMKTSIDAINESLIQDESKYNEVVDYLFDHFERNSLFEASEYLAIKALDQNTCKLNSDLVSQLETYRAMKIGNSAPDFRFEGEIINATNSISKLSDFQSEFTLVVFAASWCPKCTEEIPEIGKLYSKWKSKGVEVVSISLDDDPVSFKSFFGQFPFPSICDYKKWNGSIVNQYYVFSTPTMFLLDKKREILLRPKSVKQMDAWVEWALMEGNQN